MAVRDVYDCISPVDYRYWDEKVAHYLSENGFTRYKCHVEVALARALHRRGLCDESVVTEIATACEQVTTEEVYVEEARIRHDIRALVNCIRAKVSEGARRFVHMTATSFDISDTANAARFRDCMVDVVLPALLKLHEVLSNITVREAQTVQIGRTHGQHAVPITFGFGMAEYVSRLGDCIMRLRQLAKELPGKFSGAVGAYNAASLFFEDPEAFEREVLAELKLAPATHSTQIVQPEPLARLMFECSMAAGILANLADDMRHLQRTEIAEVGEPCEADAVGSSTMPQKRNPITLENAKSTWKIIISHITTVLLDQISEHQRDLTNSASARTYGEVLCYLVVVAQRLTRVMGKLEIDAASLERNLGMQGDLIGTEPLYITLAALGHPDAHEAARKAARYAQAHKLSLYQVITADPALSDYWFRMSESQQEKIRQPVTYTGIAEQKAINVAQNWLSALSYKY